MQPKQIRDERSKSRKQKLRNHHEALPAKYFPKAKNTCLAHRRYPFLISRVPMKASRNESKKARKAVKESVEKLVRGADAGERLGGHRVDRLVLCDTQRILVADQSLGVELERLAHQFGDSIAS
jgi:hypothetical protein